MAKQTDLIKSVDAALRLVLRNANINQSHIPQKVTYKVTDDEFMAILPDYAAYVDGGRKAGKMPPVKDILMWIKQKGIKPGKGMRQIDVAFAIARSISKKGVKARPFLDVFQEEIADLLLKQIDNEIDNQLKDKK